MATDLPLRTVKTNIVQSIRAFSVADLQFSAAQLGYHFLYANLADAQSKQDILDMTALQFTFPSLASKNFDALFDHMSDALHKSGAQPGFVLVLPNLDSANIAYNLLKTAAGGNIAIGPVLLGAAKPVQILTASTTVRRIVNMTAITVADINSIK